jgi:hypothetical protein
LAPGNASAASIIADGISLCRSVVGAGTANIGTSSRGGIVITNVPSATQTGSQISTTGAAITGNGVQSSLAKKSVEIRGDFWVTFGVAGILGAFGWVAVLDF